MSAQERYERSRARFKRNDFAGALAAIREAIALDPSMSAAHDFAGWILFHQPERDLDGAIASFREARRLSPTDPAPFTNLCDALHAAARTAEAVALAQAELREHTLEAEAHHWLGSYFANAGGDVARAVAHLESATRLRSSWGAPWLALGTLLEREGALHDACRAYDTAARCSQIDRKLARRCWNQVAKKMRARGEAPSKEPWRGMDGQPLGPEYEAIATMFDEHRLEAAVDAIEALAKKDWMATIYTIGFTERAAATAYQEGRRELARRFADLAIRGATEWASGASSGGEGIARTEDLKQAIKRMARFR